MGRFVNADSLVSTGHAWEDIEYTLKKVVDFVVQGAVFVFFPVTSTLGRQLHYNTPEDRGTFNVYSGENWVLNFTVHGGFDVVPYMIWGNSWDDSTAIVDRLIMIWR